MAVRTTPRSPSLKGARAPQLPRIRLAPLRPRGSLELDSRQTARGKLTLPPFVRWDEFLSEFRWRQGEHLTTIGPTGSGKTVLNRALLAQWRYVVVLGVKNRDPELYGPFQQQGYELVRHFNPDVPAGATSQRVLFVPQTSEHGAAGRKKKGAAFRTALNDIYDAGDWTVYADDVQYLADQLRLDTELEELWMLGRSEGVTLVASSQEPVDIPVMAYGMATHLFLYGNPDLRRAQRMAELTGMNREIAVETILALPEHEFLYINRKTRRMVRSKVILT